MFLRPLFWKTDEAGRFLFLFPKNRWGHFLIYHFIKYLWGPFLFILSIKMLIFGFWHMNKINEATFLFKSEKKTDEGRWFETDEGGHEKHFFFIWPYTKSLLHQTDWKIPSAKIHTGKFIRRLAGIYAYCRYFIDRKW